MSEYRVMRWYSAMDGPWSPGASQRFREQGFDGLVVVPSQDWTPQSLDFLGELEGLRSFSFTGKIKNDLAVFELESLEDLTLVTGSKAVIPETVQPHLTRLVLTDRPGLIVKPRWPKLSALRVGEWRATDLQMLNTAAELTHVYLEGRRQKGTLYGIEACASLESLIIVNYSVSSIGSLRNLDSLVELKLLAAKPTPAHGAIDLSVLTSPRLAKLWISNASGLLNLESLAGRPLLRELRLIDCQLSDAETHALSTFSNQIDVQVVKG